MPFVKLRTHIFSIHYIDFARIRCSKQKLFLRFYKCHSAVLNLFLNFKVFYINTALYMTHKPIAVRLDSLAWQFSYKICRSTDCINYLLPNKRPIELLNTLRQPNSLPGILCKINRFYRSFIPYVIKHYQKFIIQPVELSMFLLILSHCIILYVNPAILLPKNKRPAYLHSLVTLNSTLSTRSSFLVTLNRPSNPSHVQITKKSCYHTAPALGNHLLPAFRQLVCHYLQYHPSPSSLYSHKN